jgi:Holliday junction DNA helicase RuvA
MLEQLSGDVAGFAEGGFLLTVGPATIYLHASRSLLSDLSIGRHVTLPVHLQLQIEGNRVVPVAVAFGSELERELFEDFLSVSGIGAKAAVKALARPADEIASAIASGNEALLITLPGIGKAKARQIVASLQEKLSKRFAGSSPPTGGVPAYGSARDVLLRLGLSLPEADELVGKAVAALGESVPAGDIIREAMRLRGSR